MIDSLTYPRPSVDDQKNATIGITAVLQRDIGGRHTNIGGRHTDKGGRQLAAAEDRNYIGDRQPAETNRNNLSLIHI